MSSYTSPDEARSDLFLSGAAYVFGGTLFALLFSITRLDRVAFLGPGLALLLPIITTVVVPILLMRYRGESVRDLGLGGGDDDSLVPGLMSALPVIAAALLTAVLAGVSPLEGLPVAETVRTGDVFGLIVRVVQWLGLAFLALYGTVKARDAFRGEPQELSDSVVRVGRFVGILAGVALVLLILASFSTLEGLSVLALLVYPLGVAAAVAVALRTARGAASTKLPTIMTPVVLLAIGPFALTLDVTRLSFVLFEVALYAGVGLVVAVLVERTQRGAGVLLLAFLLALGTQLTGATNAAL